MSHFRIRNLSPPDATIKYVRSPVPTEQKYEFSSGLSLLTIPYSSSKVALRPRKPEELLGTGSPGRPLRLSHSPATERYVMHERSVPPPTPLHSPNPEATHRASLKWFACLSVCCTWHHDCALRLLTHRTAVN